MRRHAHRSLVLASLLSLAALACSDSGEPVIPESIAIAAGNGQTGAVGAALGTALAVTVTGSDGDPMEGATVTWAVTAGGGTITPTTSTTDALGRASATWTLGGSTGQQAATATVQGLAAAAFTATATVGAPATVTMTPASPTIDALQGTVQLAAQAKDAFGNDVAGSTFVWTSLDPSTVTVNAQTGLATGVKVGTAQVTAVTAGKTGTVSVQVRQVPTSIVIGPANPRVSAGGTIQLTATARDANGNAIPGQTFTWSSATSGVATVNGSGLVTGVAGGTSNVTATSGSLNATIAVNVVNNLAPTSNTTVSGTLNIGRLTIPAGVTVTATSDVVINAFDAIQVNGTLVGNCVDITINGTAAATYAGTIRNTCTAPGTGGTADMLLANDGPLTVSNATFEYDGSFELKNDPAITPATTGAPLPASPLALSVSQTGACTVTGTTFRPSTAAARAGANGTSSGGNGASAGGVRLLCDGDLNIGGGAAVEARDGGAGGDGLHSAPTTDNATGRGGDGGNGGDLNIRANGNITFTGTTLRLASGGDGGDQTVLGRDPGGNATATAGNGGNGGNTRVVASGSINIATGGLTIIVGRGGHGGEAIANAGNGLNAGTSAATAGGNATATGGNGGNSVDGRLTAGGAVTGLTNIAISGGDGGEGGEATAVAGKGGDGNLEFPNGAAGGAMEAHGGDGGVARTKDITGSVVGRSGDGGNMRISNGRGGNGANRCSVPAPGGNGGRGGNGSGDAGTRGAGDNPGVDGSITVAAATGNGGNGNSGVGPGARGEAGTDGVAAGFARTNEGPNFVPGAPGAACPPPQQQRQARIRLGTMPNSGGMVPFGTHTLALIDPQTSAVIGSIPMQTVGEAGNHYFGSGPDRVGLSGGAGNGWRVNVGEATLAGGTGVQLEEFTMCFINTFGVSGSNPILVRQFNQQGEVIRTTPITSAPSVRIDGGSASSQDHGCQHFPAENGVWFMGVYIGDGGVIDMYGMDLSLLFFPQQGGVRQR